MSSFASLMREYVHQVATIMYKHQEELNDSKYSHFVTASDTVFENFQDRFESFTITFRHLEEFGRNLQLEGLTSTYSFPLVIFSSNLRFKLLQKVLDYVDSTENFTLEQFALTVSQFTLNSFNSKVFGFTPLALETIRFFLTYGKEQDYEHAFKLYKEYLATYPHKFTSVKKKSFETSFKSTLLGNILLAPTPLFDHFNVPAIFLTAEELASLDANHQATPLGLLFNKAKEPVFSLQFISNELLYKQKKNLIQALTFFENVEFFEKRPVRYFDIMPNPMDIYYDLQDETFTERVYTLRTEFFTYKKEVQDSPDLETMNYFINTRQIYKYKFIPKIFYDYADIRIRRITHYNYKNLFMFIYETHGSSFKDHFPIIQQVLRNTFSQGFILELSKKLFCMVQVSETDFTARKPLLDEFFASFRLTVDYYTDLLSIPFSFYNLPPSQYFDPETHTWHLPIKEARPVDEQAKYLYELGRLENKRFKEDPTFREKFESFTNHLQEKDQQKVLTLRKEQNELKKKQAKKRKK